jgi:hypothetical protein
MNWSDCPVGCPVVWRPHLESACTHAAFWATVPANVFPGVRAGHVSCASLEPRAGLPDYVPVVESRGVVVSCPLPRPFAQPLPPLPSLPLHLPLPANGGINEVQVACAQGGER